MDWGIGVDAGILFFLVLQTYLGLRRGLLWLAAGGMSVLLGVGLGLLFSPVIGAYALERVTSNPLHARLIGFLAVFGLVGFTLRIIAACVIVHSEKGLPKEERDHRRKKDRILGGVFGALKGLVLAAIAVAACAAFYPGAPAWKKSHLAPVFATTGSRLLPNGAVQEMRTWAKQHVASMTAYDKP
jgi:uncharacterized membrane protein required for colicin V production